MDNEDNINNNLNIEEFFQVYPPIKKINSIESNKFNKLFIKPIKRGLKKKRNSPKLSYNNSNQNFSFNSVKKFKLELMDESLNESNKIFSEKNSYISSTIKNRESNSFDTRSKPIDNTIEFSNDDDNNYYLINKGLHLQKEKRKRTHSIKKSLEQFLYNTNVIEKLKKNLYSIELNIKMDNDGEGNQNQIIENNGEINKNDEAKIKYKINSIVKKLANKLIIEKVPENKFIIKMNEKGDNCYFLLSGKLSVLKPVEYKNIKISYQDYILYLINLLKYHEIDLINQILKINHYFVNIKSLEDLKIIIKGYFIEKLKKYLELFNTLTYEDIITILNNYNLTFEDFNLDKSQVMKDLDDIDTNRYNKKDSNGDNNEDSENENEKKEEGLINKGIVLKKYILNKFKLSIENKIVLMNYNFLFNTFEEKNLFDLTLFKYENFLYLNPGSFFGDMALESKIKKRNATIRSEEECFILSLSNDDYISFLFEDNKKLKSLDLLFLTSKFFFTDVSPVLFDRYYFSMFKSSDKIKGDIIYQQETEFSSVYFLKEGNVSLDINASIIDIHNLIKFYIDILEEKNYLNYSSKKIKAIKNNYLNDKEMFNLINKNSIYLEKFNEKQKFEISKVNKNECLGDLELFITSGYIHTCTVISQKASIIEIKKKDLCKIFNEEKDVLPNYYHFVMNKLISQIKRLYYLKSNYIIQIKSKVKNNFYGNIVSPNFFVQKSNENTSKYYSKKKEMKKIVPKIFKFAHFDPPIIYDSKWNQKVFHKEKNEIYFFKQKEIENNKKNLDDNINENQTNEKNNDSNKNENDINNDINNKKLNNLRMKKILEEVSTSKTLTHSISKSKSRNKNRDDLCNNYCNDIIYKTQLKRVNSEFFGKKLTNSQTIVAGQYHLSLSKLAKQLNNSRKFNLNNLNIVKNNDDEILKERALLSKSQLKQDFSNSSYSLILPPIKKFKKNNIIPINKRKVNIFRSNNSFVDISIGLDNNSLNSRNIQEKANLAISQVVKNFYQKQKNIGYSSLINRNNNRYYKIGRKEISKSLSKLF